MHETTNTLRYASRAKRIKSKPVVKMVGLTHLDEKIALILSKIKLHYKENRYGVYVKREKPQIIPNYIRL